MEPQLISKSKIAKKQENPKEPATDHQESKQPDLSSEQDKPPVANTIANHEDVKSSESEDINPEMLENLMKQLSLAENKIESSKAKLKEWSESSNNALNLSKGSNIEFKPEERAELEKA